jgi:hypothetical protein
MLKNNKTATIILQNKQCFLFITTLLLLVAAALWVPIKLQVHQEFYTPTLLNGIQPRALIGTLVNLLEIGPLGYSVIRLLSLFVWLYLILKYLCGALLIQSEIPKKNILYFLILAFIFAFSTPVFMTFRPVGFLDIIPSCLEIISVVLLQTIKKRPLWLTISMVTTLLSAAVMTHEKSIFDIAIIAIWSLWRIGSWKSILIFSPTTFISGIFFQLIANKAAYAGVGYALSPTGYFTILQSGMQFFLTESLNVGAIIFGGGALWVFYLLFCKSFISSEFQTYKKIIRFFLVCVLGLLTFAPLLVANDTNRLIGLIWLPTFLIMGEIDLRKTLDSFNFSIWAWGLALFQLLMPPSLIYINGAVPYNCYSKFLWKFLPNMDGVINIQVGPWGIFAMRRPDLINDLHCGVLPLLLKTLGMIVILSAISLYLKKYVLIKILPLPSR